MAGKSSSVSKGAIWILMGLLILGLGGFGVTNLGGTVRSVGNVGETPLEVTEYARALRNEIDAESNARQEPVNFFRAQELGIDTRVLAQQVSAAALEEEVRLMGVSIGDKNLRDQILAIPGFRGVDGEFDREAYSFALRNQNLTEAEFEENMRAETARTLLQGAVVAGIQMPDVYTDTLLTYIGETRSVSYARLAREDLSTGLPVAEEADLAAYHEANIADFTIPETKRITYAWLTPDMIIDTVEVDEDSLRALYEDRADEFNQPERRLVERLAFTDVATADNARDALDAGETTFEALVEERGLDLADVDMGDVALTDLDLAGEAVFAAEAGSIVGPIESPVGPALFRVNAILQAQETPFEEAEPLLRDELAADRARRVIDAEIDAIDDLLAGGATLEDLEKETPLKLGQIDWHAGQTDGIAAYDAFRDAADAITQEDFPEVEKLEDEGIFAMRLDEIVPPQVQPLEDVREAVESAWRDDAVTTALRDQAGALVAQLENGAEFADLGLGDASTVDFNRGEIQPGVPPALTEAIFGLEPGKVAVTDGLGELFIARLDKTTAPDMQDERMIRLRDVLRNDAAQGKSLDLYNLLTADIRQRAGVQIDQQALNAVHSNFQ